MKMISFDFETWLKETLERKNISGYALAQKSGLSDYTIYSYLRGERSPTLMTFLYILDAMSMEMRLVDKRGR